MNKKEIFIEGRPKKKELFAENDFPMHPIFYVWVFIVCFWKNSLMKRKSAGKRQKIFRMPRSARYAENVIIKISPFLFCLLMSKRYLGKQKFFYDVLHL